MTHKNIVVSIMLVEKLMYACFDFFYLKCLHSSGGLWPNVLLNHKWRAWKLWR